LARIDVWAFAKFGCIYPVDNVGKTENPAQLKQASGVQI